MSFNDICWFYHMLIKNISLKTGFFLFESCRSHRYFTTNNSFHRNFLAVILAYRTDVSFVGNSFLENRIDIWAGEDSKLIDLKYTVGNRFRIQNRYGTF
jgi:hypothetical protein